MLDIQFVRDHRETVEANCKNRHVACDVGRVIERDDRRKQLVQIAQVKQQRANEVSKLIPKEKDAARKQELIQEGRALREEIAGLEEERKQAELERDAALATLPNLTHPDAPVGNDNKVIKTVGQPRTFDFPVKDHVALAEALDLVDFDAGSKVAGPKFYFLKNDAVLLELALVQYALDRVLRHGFSPIITPDLARIEVLEGIGYMPRGPETQIYSVANTDLCLIATAEITLGGMLRDEVLDEAQLPLRYVGLSHCFRTEAGAPGRDTRGLYRVHQFTKVEMFVFCAPEQSDAEHEQLRAIEEEIFQGLGLSFQVIDTCTGDLGGPAYRKYDLEAWMPGRGQAGEYGEVTSTSNCTDFQARRLNIRSKGPGHKGTRYIHTLNGTAVAVSRALVALLENNQQADGSVTIPEALRPWMHGKERIGPAKAH